MKKEAYNEDAPMKRSTSALKTIAAHLIKWREDLGLTAEDIAQRGDILPIALKRYHCSVVSGTNVALRAVPLVAL